jgi:hypothetical protein
MQSYESALTIFNANPTLLAVTIKEPNPSSDLCKFCDLLLFILPGYRHELAEFSVWEHTWQSSCNRRNKLTGWLPGTRLWLNNNIYLANLKIPCYYVTYNIHHNHHKVLIQDRGSQPTACRPHVATREIKPDWSYIMGFSTYPALGLSLSKCSFLVEQLIKQNQSHLFH